MARPTGRRRDRHTLKDKKRENTRQRLISAAKHLFAEHGYDDVPVTEIAQEAGVTHSMINVYFGGKPGLLYEIVKQNKAPQYDDVLRIVEGDGPALVRLSAVLRSWLAADAREPRLLAIMHSYSWVWPPGTEQENAADRGRHIALVARLLREVRPSEGWAGNAEEAAEAVFAIYTWTHRGILFDGQSVEACHMTLMARIHALTGLSAPDTQP